MCEMRSGTLLTGGGKDRKIIMWDHELRAERDIEVKLRAVRQLVAAPQAVILWFDPFVDHGLCLKVPDHYGTIRAVSEGKGDEFLVGTSRNFILRGTFFDGFVVLVQVRSDSSNQLNRSKLVSINFYDLILSL